MSWRRVLQDIARDIEAAESALREGDWSQGQSAWNPPEGLGEPSPDEASEAAELLGRLHSLQMQLEDSRAELAGELKVGREQLAVARTYSMVENLPRSS